MLVEHREDGISWLVFDKPDRLNSFMPDDYADLRRALARDTEDPATKVIVLAGNGRAFSAGVDRSVIDGSAGPAEGKRAGEEFVALVETLARCDKPLLAAVAGYAIGIGATMLLYCDLVLAAESARFRFPFTSLGITPEAGSSVLLFARTRWADAMWAMLSSEWIDAAAAREMGLAWRVVPDEVLREEAQRAAATLAALDPASVSATKRLLTDGRAEAARAAVDREFAQMRALGQSRTAD
jgi:enoyl-CoA hydratase/carnithine racemase